MKYFDIEFSLIIGYRFLLRQIIEFISSLDRYAHRKESVILDIGCGRKPYKKLFKLYRYLGLDLFRDISLPDIYGSITDLPFVNESIDACLTVWVLDDLPEPDKGISEIARVLKPGGYYFAVEAQMTNRHFKSHDYFRFAPNAIEYLCTEANLKLIESKSYGGNLALIGFSTIIVCRKLFYHLGIDNLARPFYSFFINLIFAPLDWLSRRFMKDAVEDNSLGYCYILKKKD